MVAHLNQLKALETTESVRSFFQAKNDRQDEIFSEFVKLEQGKWDKNDKRQAE